ncbi:MAG: M18 family aminopeptidase [Alkalispirochaetaceae bacterium]
MSDLLSFLEASPTAHHGTREVARLLLAAGGVELSPGNWELPVGEIRFFRRGTGLIGAIRRGRGKLLESGCRVAVAHTDSPSLQLKIRGVKSSGALRSAPVEVYGSPILSTWLDRPLEVAGTVAVESAGGIELIPVRSRRGMGVIPNLAIHLNRKVNEGYAYDTQTQMRPLLDATVLERGLLEELCSLEGVDPRKVVDSELYLVPAEPPTSWGEGDRGFFTASRIDNLAGVWANLQGFLQAEPGEATQILLFFDHEEIGSLSRSGARSPWLHSILRRLTEGEGEGALDLLSSRSLLLSNDATHGNHPNFPEKLDPDYLPELSGGPAIKLSAVRRYATEPEATAMLRLIAREAEVDLQLIQNRADLPAGTTVGPMSSSSTLLPTVDFGIPILGMHSARETAHLADIDATCRLMRGLFESSVPARLRSYR